MASQESKYVDLLRSLGFSIQKEPSEVRDGLIQKLPQLPKTPVYLHVKKEESKATFVIDEKGVFWFAIGEWHDFSDYGFRSYVEFVGLPTPETKRH